MRAENKQEELKRLKKVSEVTLTNNKINSIVSDFCLKVKLNFSDEH